MSRVSRPVSSVSRVVSRAGVEGVEADTGCDGVKGVEVDVKVGCQGCRGWVSRVSSLPSMVNKL